MRGLESKRAVVTGAGRGLGLAVATRLLEEGASVVLADIDADAAAAAVSGLRKREFRADDVILDVGDDGSVERAMAVAIQLLGGLDILVNNAGIVRDGKFADLTPQAWEEVINVNLTGSYRCIRAGLADLQESPAGRIVNVSSRAYLGSPGQSNYAAAKAGLLGLTRTLSLEFGRFGITVNSVAPGLMDTDLVRSHEKAEEIVEREIRTLPIRRIGQPSEVGAAIAFLASEDAGYITGEVLHVTGGGY